MPELARLLDPTELDASTGPHGRMTVDVSAAQLGGAVEILVPSRLACARCDGGGCDACGRSGGIRLALDAAERKTHLVLPKHAPSPLLVRLVEPLGDGATLAQLTIEVHITPAPRSHRAVIVVVGLALIVLGFVLEWTR